MIRIFFTDLDLARFRIAAEPSPMWEILLSLHVLQIRTRSPIFRYWRDQTRQRLSRSMRPLFELAPAYGYSPDFLTPSIGDSNLEAGLDALAATPRARLRADLGQLAGYQQVTSWMRELADGRAASLGVLTDATRRYHQVAIAPYWTRIRAGVDAERTAHARLLAATGFEGLMGVIHPDIRWRPPVLELHGFTANRDIHLDGRGLHLLPSYFCWQQPTLLRDPDLPPVLVYPIERDAVGLGVAGPAAPSDRKALVALLGRTRAAVLEAIDAGCTTTELARRVGVSPATASEHATVLREAGLITTRRLGGSVLHSLHPLGATILTQQRHR
ncbi:ArsR/SmtB family transcription factor [Micromonospora polyrhachis]|uniref:DNA-binding transcriptional ArsR family regulator/transcriptional regulator with XRE-family HTH domain n=1 Tax=Micromonospora polyrhachis TaxID=1282883 RepID=A0A7W7WME8_9ACTN|nr:winged helix-turn-helix domain-containing protein [Micromonospora polyrhachis]MBB4956750.1 DNA-binding transcriptional ArsR family regulator/transcriptional regulator with XRE-family HTH domain [Micromonospora polyrhachis]